MNDDGHVTDNEGMGDYEEYNYVDYNDYADDDRQNSSYDDASENEGNYKTLIMKSAVFFKYELHVFICLHNL